MTTREEIAGWRGELDALHGRIGHRFRRAEARERAKRYLAGLLERVERKNGWQLAEHLGEPGPQGVQRLLNAADWDVDAVRDDLRSYVSEHLGDPAGVLIVDETGFLKKGTKSVGCSASTAARPAALRTARSGSSWATPAPRGEPSWIGSCICPGVGAGRRAAAGSGGAGCGHLRDQAAVGPTDAGARLCRRGPGRLGDRGRDLRGRWPVPPLAGGGEPPVRPRRLLQPSGLADRHPRAGGPPHRGPAAGSVGTPVGGRGEPGRAAVRLGVHPGAPTSAARGWRHWLLARRSLSDPTELAYYRVFGPADTPVAAMVRVAGMRWAIEASFEDAKGAVGLDHYEVRKWTAWYRHVTLALLAHAYLEVTRLHAHAGKKGALRA